MLGFSSYSEVPYSQAVTSVQANAFLTGGAPGTGELGTFTFIQVANKSIASVTASSTANAFGDVEGESNPSPTGVSANTAISNFTSVTGKATKTLPAGTSTGSAGSLVTKGGGGVGINTLGVNLFSLGTLELSAKAKTTLPSVLGDVAVGALQGPSIEEDIVSVSATGSSGTLTATGGAKSTPSSVQATVVNNAVSLIVTKDLSLSSVQGTMSLGLSASTKASARVLGVSASTDIHNVSTNAVQKIYSSTDFVQSHVVTIHTKITNKIVYVRK